MKVKELYDLLDSTSKIELRSYWEDKGLIEEYNSKYDISDKYLHVDVMEISQRGDLYIVIYLNRTVK